MRKPGGNARPFFNPGPTVKKGLPAAPGASHYNGVWRMQRCGPTAVRLPEGCPGRLDFAILPNNFFQIPVRGRNFGFAAPYVFPTEYQ